MEGRTVPYGRTDRHDKADSRSFETVLQKSLKYVKRDSKKLTHTHTHTHTHIHTASYANADGSSLHRANRKDDFKEESPNTHVTQISVINRRSEAERAWGEDCTTQCHKAEFIHKEIKKERKRN